MPSHGPSYSYFMILCVISTSQDLIKVGHSSNSSINNTIDTVYQIMTYVPASGHQGQDKILKTLFLNA